MDEHQFMIDLWDILAGHDEYCTIEQFREKYRDLREEGLADGNTIKFSDEHNEWTLEIRKTWADNHSINKA